jgi:hypothetical protein
METLMAAKAAYGIIEITSRKGMDVIILLINPP